jgi:hypothetical protein
VFAVFAASGRTGELRLKRDRSTVIIYFRCGEIVFVTSLDPADYTSAETGAVEGVPADALAFAVREQRASGKPFHVTLAEQGVLPVDCDLSRVLHRAGRKILVDVLESPEQSFAWRDAASLPAYVEAYGRAMPVSRDLPVDDPEPEVVWPLSGEVPSRTSEFGDLIREVTLSARERRVLMLIDGKTSIETIAIRSGLDLEYVGHITRALADIGLVRGADDTGDLGLQELKEM